MTTFPELAALLRKWNRSIRLVGDDSDAALERHFEDALALLDVLPERGRLVDIGSGNGLPAFPVAITRPELDLTLVEPIAKKVAFLRACRRELQLDNVRVVRARDDELLARPDFVAFDIAVSQATFAPAEWLTRGAELVGDNGLVIAMVGERRDGLDAFETPLEIRELATGDGRERALVLRRLDRSR